MQTSPPSPSARLSRHLETLARRWPALAADLDGVGEPPCQWSDEAPQGSLVIDGIHLASGFDRVAEAELQAGLIPEQSPDASIYGVGCGELPRQLLRRPQLNRLTVVVLNLGVLRASLAHYDHTDWLSDPRVALIAADERLAVNAPFCAIPPELQLCADHAAALRDRVQLELDSLLINRRFEQQQEHHAHIGANLAALERDGDVAELFQRHEGGAISVVAAGPTLDHHYGFLANPQPIIVVDHALRQLVSHGITPDYVISIDPSERVTEYLDIPAERARAITLVYSPTIPNAAIEAWPGRRLAAYGESAVYDEAARRIDKAKLFHSGSVIHPAVDLAVRMGASHVLLFGADFSFPFGKRHADGSRVGAKQAPEGGAWVHDWRGERVATLNNLRGYLRDLESYLQRHSKVRFYSFGEQGARIAGSRLIRGER